MSTDDPWVSAEEIARDLRISKMIVWRWCQTDRFRTGTLNLQETEWWVRSSEYNERRIELMAWAVELHRAANPSLTQRISNAVNSFIEDWF